MPRIDWRRTANGEGPVAAAFAFFLLIVYAVCVAAVPIRADNDCWWHVKTGKVIAESGLPEHDVFAYTAADREWHNHEWLTQLAAWHIFDAGESTGIGGWRAVIAAASLTLAASFAVLMLLAARLSRNWWIGLLVAAIAVGLGRRTFYARPPVVTNLMLALELLLVIGVQQRWWRRAWLWLLPPMVALWTNLHGGWMAGGVVLAALCGQDFVAWAAHRMKWKSCSGPPAVAPAYWIAVGAATLLATLCNPYGWKLYELPLRVMSDRALVESIGELMPPNWRFAYDTPMAVALVLGAAVVLAVRRRLGFFRVGEAAIFAFFLWQGASHVRHLLLFAVAMVPMAARVLAEVLGKDEGGGMRDEESAAKLSSSSSSSPILANANAPLDADGTALPHGRATACRPLSSSFILHPSSFLVVALLWSAMILRNWPEGDSYVARHRAFWADRTGYVTWKFPEAVCDFVDLAGIEGRMFNENHYAGYLIWRWSPEKHQVFSDSRFDIFGGDIWREERIVEAGHEPEEGEDTPSWRQVLDKWDVQWAFVWSPMDAKSPNHGALERRLRAKGSGWQIVADWSAVPNSPHEIQIWVRDAPANADTIRRARRMFESMMHVELGP